MRMPGFVMEGALPSATATAAVGRPGSVLLSGVVAQQGCTAAKWNECLGKAGGLHPDVRHRQYHRLPALLHARRTRLHTVHHEPVVTP